MGRIKHVGILVPGYPTEKEPYSFTFIDKLVCEIADLNIKCTVISPRELIPKNHKMLPPEHWKKETLSGNQIDIYCPRYLYFFAKNIGFFNTGRLSSYTYENAVEKTIKKYNLKFDFLYGHFIHPSGVAVARIGKRLNCPSYFAYGESSTWGIEIYGNKRLNNCFENINGVVAVSTDKKRELINYNIIEPRKIEVFPNGIDRNKFYPRAKEKMREKYGLPKNAFIVGYTGRFNESKGVMRVTEALGQQDDIKLVLIGGGNLKPESNNILYKGLLPHDEVPLMLSACDIFVLPTKNEGCCNAIIEAMACGLPIISSSNSFNDDILDESYSIRINPDNINDIRNAVDLLKENEDLRLNMGKEALKASSKFDISKRAKNILNWMNVLDQ